MLEDLALQYVDLSDGAYDAVNYGIVLLGAVAGAVTNKSQLALARVPYFVYLILISFFVTATQFIWLLFFPAMAGGYLWAIVTASIISFAAAGVFAVRIAIARSRSAFGHGRWAFLAFIPLLNLILIFKPPTKKVSVYHAPKSPLLTGALGILLGFAILVAGVGLNALLEYKLEEAAERAESDPDLTEMDMKLSLRSEGLEETLGLTATGAQTPVVIDSQTVLS